jgi:hypothetical protein
VADSETALWITAWATALTAILTGTGGLAAWLSLRRERQRELPIIERSARWSDDHVTVDVTIRNRLPETITLEEITVLAPRGATISSAYGPPRSEDPWRGPGPPVRTTAKTLEKGSEIRPLGTPRGDFHGGDAGRVEFAIWPPASWKQGTLKVALRISSKAGTIRGRRAVLLVVVPAKEA